MRADLRKDCWQNREGNADGEGRELHQVVGCCVVLWELVRCGTLVGALLLHFILSHRPPRQSKPRIHRFLPSCYVTAAGGASSTLQ